MNTLLKPSVVVRSAEVAPPGFDARRSARARRYRYLILEDLTPDPLLAPLSWHVPGPLDLRAMASAADALLGEHDFAGFLPTGARHGARDAHPRRVLDARFVEVRAWPAELGPDGRLLRFDIEATSFCHQMVRSVVGTLVEVGRGRRRASDVNWLLQSGDRSRVGGVIAPPHGLCLIGVDLRRVSRASQLRFSEAPRRLPGAVQRLTLSAGFVQELPLCSALPQVGRHPSLKGP